MRKAEKKQNQADLAAFTVGMILILILITIYLL